MTKTGELVRLLERQESLPWWPIRREDQPEIVDAAMGALPELRALCWLPAEEAPFNKEVLVCGDTTIPGRYFAMRLTKNTDRPGSADSWVTREGWTIKPSHYRELPPEPGVGQ